MTVKEFLERNEQIRSVAEKYGIDIDLFDVRFLLSGNLEFVIRKSCLKDLKPDADGNYIVRVQISDYRVCSYQAVLGTGWNDFLKQHGIAGGDPDA